MQQPELTSPQSVTVREAVGALDVPKPPPSIADLLQGVIQGGVSKENVAVVTEVVALYERMQAKEAEKAFARAFNALQAEMPAIQAMTAVPNNDGTVRYRYAPYEEIMEQVRPLLLKHGFTVTFSTDYAEGRLVKTCTLQHTEGHSKSNQFAVRIGKGPPAASETQADGAASTYAKRGALCDCLNIVIDKDTDARAIGAFVTDAQADELHRRVKESDSNEIAFLRFCGVTLTPGISPTFADYQKIPEGRYDAADEMLRRKESKGR